MSRHFFDNQNGLEGGSVQWVGHLLEVVQKTELHLND